MKKRRKKPQEEYEYAEEPDEGLAWHTKVWTVILVQLLLFVCMLTRSLWDLLVIVAIGLRDLICYLWPKRATPDQEE